MRINTHFFSGATKFLIPAVPLEAESNIRCLYQPLSKLSVALYILLFLPSSSLAQHGEKSEDDIVNEHLKTVDGEIIPQSKIIRTSTEGVRVMFPGSVKTIPWDEWTEDSKNSLGYKRIKQQIQASILEQDKKNQSKNERQENAIQLLRDQVGGETALKNDETLNVVLKSYQKNKLPGVVDGKLTFKSIINLLGKPDKQKKTKIISRQYILASANTRALRLQGIKSEDPVITYDQGVAFIYEDKYAKDKLGYQNDLVIYFYSDNGALAEYTTKNGDLKIWR